MPKHILALIAAATLAVLPQIASAQAPVVPTCGAGGQRSDNLKPGSKLSPTNLIVDGKCRVGRDTYYYKNINVVAGGELKFDDARIDLWTSGIIIENGGAMIAGDPPVSPAVVPKPIAGPLTIHLWGADQGAAQTGLGGAGIPCVSDTLAAKKAGQPAPAEDHCGIPKSVWDNGEDQKVPVNGPADDYFYQYEPLFYDKAGTPVGYFGYKSIGVSYGGTLQLFGKKGATYAAGVKSSDSGMSWRRLQGTVVPGGGRKFVVDQKVDWVPGDKVVVTTTDYLPSHSEELEIIGPASADGRTFNVKDPFQYRHQGEKYKLPNDLARLKLQGNPADVETRAAVALLSRSIVIVSEGDTIGEPLAANSYFGGHTLARQGFKTFQVQGVEFRLLGQGGRIGHYPVHFHMARTVPSDKPAPNDNPVPGGTFVKDTSVNESMTRWYALHNTNGVLLARNVGWKSIGHGYYIEEGSEVDNKFQSNIGIYARPAIENAVVNPRNVPGILAAPYDATKPENVPFYSDVDSPSVFWIMNGWNDFEYNMAAGAGTCGACYWLVPGANSGHSRHAMLTGYASMQQTMSPNPLEKAGTTPLRKFVGNYCTTAMNSFNTVGNSGVCEGVQRGNPVVAGVPNALAPNWCDQTNPLPPPPSSCGPPATPPYPITCTLGCQIANNKIADAYYPKVSQGGGRFATICPDESEDCSTTIRCNTDNLGNCEVTVIDAYTSSFHWSQTNFAAIWLRPQWFLFANSVLTDVQNGGLSFVTGGGYTKSDGLQGHWALARKSVFIGNTQAPITAPGVKDYASNAGPFNPKGIPATGQPTPNFNCSGNYCLSKEDGVSFPSVAFAMNQRLFSIYDGPAYQESNAYVDITRTLINDCGINGLGGNCQNTSTTLSGRILGLPGNTTIGCYMPNAAIAWKQSNGFYYPPAFHSANLYFKNVDIRHYVISPVFSGDTYKTDEPLAKLSYCNTNPTMFANWSDIDRQTELSDDDGSLTGYAKTVSINTDPFFKAPVEAYECASDATVIALNTPPVPGTAKTSPYDYVTTVMYPEAGFTNLFPTGVTQTAITTNTCGASVTPTRITMNPGQVVPPGGCTIVVEITSNTPGTYTNTTSMLQTVLQAATADIGIAPSVSAQLTVTGGGPRAPLPPAASPRRVTAAAVLPTLAMTISPATIAPGGTATLTITMGNANANPVELTTPGWSRQCSNEHCFGVPMYRQSLLKGENTAGPIRLAGQNTYNRSALSVNNGIFYIDTTPGDATQQAWNPPSDKNVFQPDTHYYLFALFAKPKTAQTYQVYVGTPFDPNKDVWATRADIKNLPVRFSPPGYVAWPAGWGRSYNAATGVLTVTMNMGFPDFATNYNKSFQEICQPASFCTWTESRSNPQGGTCGCTPSGRFFGLCSDTNTAGENVCAWAQKDVDCPSGGCYGIGLKTGSTFVYDPAPAANPRPAQACFPKDAVWNVKYIDAAPGLAGAAPICTNAPKLPLQFCGD